MNTHADNGRGQQSKAVANDAPEKHPGDELFSPISDNRPDSGIQRKLLSQIADSSQVKQLKAFQEMVSNGLPGLKNGTEQGMPESSGNEPIQRKTNDGGLPLQLKAGIESLSGYSMDDITVHYNSSEPAQLNALAFAQGTDIHLAGGQEKHLPHEAWHVVQQKQGRVKPTFQLKGKTNINDDASLEQEADVMGAKAAQFRPAVNSGTSKQATQTDTAPGVVQRLTGYELEANFPLFGKYNEIGDQLTEKGANGFTETIGWFLTGGLKYGQNYGEDPEGRYVISADHNDLMGIHRQLVDKLIVLGLLKEGFKFRSLANAEYITPPRQEVGPGGIDEHQKDITAVKNHLSASVAAASAKRVADVPAPGQQILTGFPLTELREWVQANDIPVALISKELQDMEQAINNEIYLQETTGVLPEDIPALYGVASEYMMREENNPTKLTKLMAGLMTKATAIGQAVYAAADNLPPAFVTHQKALKGYFALLASYLLADNVSFLKQFTQAKSTDKNLLPFLSKTKLSDTLAALPPEVRPTNAMDDPWRSFAATLVTQAATCPKEYWAATYDMDIDADKAQGTVFPAGHADALGKLIAGTEVIGVNSGKTLTLDDPHPEVATSTGQKGIPMEDRYYRTKLDSATTAVNVEERLKRRFTSVAAVQIGHIPETDGKKLAAVNETATPLTAKQKQDQQIGRIRERIAEVRKLFPVWAMTQEDEPDVEEGVGAVELRLQEALTKGAEEKAILLNGIDNDLYAAITEMQQAKSILTNSNTDDDRELTVSGSAGRLAAAFDMEFGLKLLEFKNKNCKPELLAAEEDQLTMTEHQKQISKTHQLYNLAKVKLTALTNAKADTERVKVMKMIRILINRIGEETQAAASFFDQKPKKAL